jgi:hypothetical protein
MKFKIVKELEYIFLQLYPVRHWFFYSYCWLGGGVNPTLFQFRETVVSIDAIH